MQFVTIKPMIFIKIISFSIVIPIVSTFSKVNLTSANEKRQIDWSWVCNSVSLDVLLQIFDDIQYTPGQEWLNVKREDFDEPGRMCLTAYA